MAKYKYRRNLKFNNKKQNNFLTNDIDTRSIGEFLIIHLIEYK